MTIRRAAIVIGMTMLALAASACSSTTKPEASLTPAITLPTAGDDLRGLLVTDDQLRRAGLPADLTARPSDDLTLYENPDPRGPCGAAIDQSDLFADGVVQFAGSTVAVLESVSRLPSGRADELLGAIEADIRPGCPEFISRTNTGADQTNRFGAPIDLGDIDAEAIGWQTTQGVRGQVAHAYVGLVRDGDVVVSLVIIAPTLLDISVVHQAIRAAADQLRSTSPPPTT